MTITCFEHESLDVGTQGFTSRHFEMVAAWLDKHRTQYFRLGNQRLHFGQWVGVFQVSDLTIQILPKAEANRTPPTREVLVVKWKGILLNMLKEAHYLDLHALESASLNVQNHTILDLVFERFLDHAEELLAQGLVKRYRMVESNRTAVKGRILHSVNERLNVIHRERIFTVASEYDRDNIWNRILHHAALLTSAYARSPQLRARAHGIALAFPEWDSESLDPLIFGRLHYDRKTDTYRNLNRYAELIISQLNPDIQGGKSPIFALLFDMNVLWESWVFHRLRRHLASEPAITVSGQISKLFWYAGQENRKTVRPDIVIKRPGTPTIIVDTKWKVLTVSTPDDNDLKQMFVYNQLFDCPKSYLIYPKVHSLAETSGNYTVGESALGLRFLDVENPGEILGAILES